MEARFFIPVSAPNKSEKTYILYWHTGLNQYDPLEFLNRAQHKLLQASKDCVHRTIHGIDRARPLRRHEPMDGCPYVLELDLPLGVTSSLMRDNNFAKFAAHVRKVHAVYAGKRDEGMAISFDAGKFVAAAKPALKI